jgi:hypothetical protein
MRTLPWQNRLYGHLLRESQKGAIQRHCAFMAAGWLSLFLVRPKLVGRRAASATTIAGGGVLLVVALVLLVGPLLNLLQPVLRPPAAYRWNVPVVAVLALLPGGMLPAERSGPHLLTCRERRKP